MTEHDLHDAVPDRTRRPSGRADSGFEQDVSGQLEWAEQKLVSTHLEELYHHRSDTAAEATHDICATNSPPQAHDTQHSQATTLFNPHRRHTDPHPRPSGPEHAPEHSPIQPRRSSRASSKQYSSSSSGSTSTASRRQRCSRVPDNLTSYRPRTRRISSAPQPAPDFNSALALHEQSCQLFSALSTTATPLDHRHHTSMSAARHHHPSRPSISVHGSYSVSSMQRLPNSEPEYILSTTLPRTATGRRQLHTRTASSSSAVALSPNYYHYHHYHPSSTSSSVIPTTLTRQAKAVAAAHALLSPPPPPPLQTAAANPSSSSPSSSSSCTTTTITDPCTLNAVMHWTSPSTRRREYAAIDASHRGLRGFARRLVPALCFGFGGGAEAAAARRQSFYDEKEDGSDAGSVRRYRIDVV